MKFLILSDSHGHMHNLEEILIREQSADAIIHLGDGAADMLTFSNFTGGKMFYQCKGNCDSAAYGFPELNMIKTEGKKIMTCHGHLQGVKFKLETLYFSAKENEADICFYGHTHIRRSDYNSGLYLFNPGAVINGEYATVEIVSEKITLLHKTL